MFDLDSFASALGWVGAALSLLSYLLVSTGRIVATSVTYQTIVLVSASTLAFSTAIFGAWPSAVTNLIYIAIGVVTISFLVWKRSAAVREAVRAALRRHAADAAHTAHVVDMRARTALEVYALPVPRRAASSPSRRPGSRPAARGEVRRRPAFVTVPKERLLVGPTHMGANAASMGSSGATVRF